MKVTNTMLKRPAFEAEILKEIYSLELMLLLFAVNNFNLVISYVSWAIMYIFSHKETQLLYIHVRQRNLQADGSNFTRS